MATFDWKTAVSGSFDTAGNWTQNAVPGSTDDAKLDATGAAYTVTAGSNDSVGTISTVVSATLAIADGTQFTLNTAGTDSNAGTITLNAGASTARLIINTPGTMMLTGGGNVILSDSTGNYIYSNSGGATLENVNNTISGAGQIYSNNGLVLKNDTAGTIDATGKNGLSISNMTVTNAGLLEATGKGGLQLNSDTITNTGTIEASGAGTHVDLSSTTIQGGNLTTATGGLIQTTASNSVLDGTNAPVTITSGSTVTVQNSTNLYLAGTAANTGVIDNLGTISLNGGSSNTDLIVGTQSAGTVQLTGGGKVTLSDSANNRIYSNQSGTTLENVNNTISGAGQIYANNGLSLTNDASGIVDATGKNGLSISNMNVSNAGLLEATGKGGLQLTSDTIANTGTIEAIGTPATTTPAAPAIIAHVDLNNTTIQGGNLTTTTGGVIQTTGSNSVLDGTSSTVTITNGSTVTVLNGTNLYLAGTASATGEIDNVGTIALNAGSGDADLIVGTGSSGTVQLTGGGSITLSDSANNRIFSNQNNTVLDNTDNTISGAGQIYANNGLSLMNEGTIEATGANNALNINNISITNTGTLEDTGAGGGLTLSNDSITNTGGTISANGDNALVSVGNVTVTGGTLTTSGTGTFDVSNGNLTLNGTTTVSGDIEGSDTLTVSAGTTTFATGATLGVANLTLATGAKANFTESLSYAGNLSNSGTIGIGSGNTVDFSSAVTGTNGKFTISGGATLEFDDSVSNQAVNFNGSSGTLALGTTASGGFSADPITGFTSGKLDLLGETATIQSYNGTTLVVNVGSGTQSFALKGAAANSLKAISDGMGGTDIVVCFATGSMIRTAHGDVAVESLDVGDMAVTASGAHRPIKWIGQRSIDCSKHPQPEMVLPVRVEAGAFGNGQPYRDLTLSPHHAVAVSCVDEILIPVRLLVNGSTIVQIEAEEITYWHVELDSHDILLVNGLGAESYIDVGNRCEFEGCETLVLHPAFKSEALAGYCRPLVTGGPVLSAIRAQLAAKIDAPLAQAPAKAGFHLLIDGIEVAPVVKGCNAAFLVPAGAQDIRLVSPSWSPRDLDPTSGDGRSLGLMIQRLAIEDLLGGVTEIALDDQRLVAGFHPVERTNISSWRWTDGDALLAAALWSSCAGPSVLRLEGTFNSGAATVATTDTRTEAVRRRA